MKKVIIFCALYLWNLNIFSQEDYKVYKIIEIEKTKNYYFISVENESKSFLIVSKKDSLFNGSNDIKLIIGKEYKMVLDIYKPSRFILGKNYVHSLEGHKVWSTNGDYKSYRTKNLNGIYYLYK